MQAPFSNRIVERPEEGVGRRIDSRVVGHGGQLIEATMRGVDGLREYLSRGAGAMDA